MSKNKKKHAIAIFCLFAFCSASISEARGIAFKNIPFSDDSGTFSGNQSQIGPEKSFLNYNSEKVLFAESKASVCNIFHGEGNEELAIMLKDDPKSLVEIKMAIAREKRRRTLGIIVLSVGAPLLALGLYALDSTSGNRDGGQVAAGLSVAICAGIPGLLFFAGGFSIINKAKKKISQYEKTNKDLLVTFSFRQTGSVFNAGLKYIF